MASSVSRTILTSVRPARVAILMNQTDADWQATCCRIIEFFSGLWGGAHNIIVPTDGNSISETFWHILNAFDADYFYFYSKTGKDLKLNHPAAYEEWLDRDFQAFSAQYPTANLDGMREQIDRQLLEQQAPSPSMELQEQIKNRLAPFHSNGRVINHGIVSGSSPTFPLSPITKVLANCDHDGKFAIHEARYGGPYPLWLASITGLATEELKNELNEIGIAAEPVSNAEYDPIGFVLNISERVGLRSAANIATPFRLANTKLALYAKSFSGIRGSIVIVAGETVFDFCLYYALSRLRNSVVWLPQDWLKSEPEGSTTGLLFDAFARELSRVKFHIDTFHRYICTSISLGQTELEALVGELDEAGTYFPAELRAKVSFSMEALLENPLRLYESDNVDKASSLTVGEGSRIDLFDTPRPKNFSGLHPYEHRWIAEVTIRGHRLPRHPSLGNWVVSHPHLTANETRIGDGGISYFCPSSMYRGWGDIDTTLVKPSIFIPTAFQVFEHIFKDNEYEARPSDKGFFAEDSIRKFGSLDMLGSLLRDGRCRELFFKYEDNRTKPVPGVHDDGALLNDKRRYLNFPSVAKVLGNDRSSQRTIEMLIGAQILYRGFVFKCRFCRNADWFAVEEVSQVFRCKRCGRTQNISAENYWYGSNEPGWFYKLDEIVLQFVRHHGYVTVLALDLLRRRSEDSFLYTSDIDVVKRGSHEPEMEVDIVCIPDGLITLGEAKKENRLGRTNREEIQEIQKYNQLGRRIGAKALVFATFAESWSQETQTNIGNILSDPDVKVILLTKSDLLAD